MGSLSGFRYGEVTRKLRAAGFRFARTAKGSHEIWRHPVTGVLTTVPHHRGEIPEGTLRAILLQAGITPEEFLHL